MMKLFEFEQIRDLALSRGYSSVTAYAALNPRKSWHDLAEELDADLAAVQLQAAIRQEAETAGNLYEYARSSLIRYLHEHLKRGWIADATDFEAAFCYGDWSASLGPELSDFTDRVWEELIGTHPPAGWLPDDIGDTYLDAAFRRAEDG